MASYADTQRKTPTQFTTSNGQSHRVRRPLRPADLDDDQVDYIQKMATRHARRCALRVPDVEDMAQEVVFRLLRRCHRYDAAKGTWKTFIAIAAKRLVANILRDKCAAKRRCDRKTSLSIPITNGEETIELGATIGQRERDARLNLRTRNDQESVDLILDVSAAVRSLPADLRGLANELQQKSISQIARERNVSRDSIYRSIRRMRKPFEQTKLQLFF